MKNAEISPLFSNLGAPVNIPLPPEPFIGREADIDAVRGSIESSGGIVRCAITGPAGIGKTALALKIADELKSDYPEGQIYLDIAAQKPLTRSDVMDRIIWQLDPSVTLPANDKVRRRLFSSALKGRSVLLVIDNADNESHIPFASPEVGMIVVSRGDIDAKGMTTHCLDVMTPVDAMALLISICDRAKIMAGELAAACGYLPIALVLAAACLDMEPTLSVKRGLQKLESAQTNAGSAEAAIAFAYSQLPQRLQRGWRVLSVFPSTFDTGFAGAVWGEEEEVAEYVLDELISWGLVSYDDVNDQYELHDSARRWARTRITDEEARIGNYLLGRFCVTLLKDINELYMGDGNDYAISLMMFDRIRHNVEAAHSYAVSQTDGSLDWDRVIIHIPWVGQLIYRDRFPFDKMIGWFTKAYTTARKTPDRVMYSGFACLLAINYAASENKAATVQIITEALEEIKDVNDDKVAVARGILLDELDKVTPRN